jgi:acetylornithine deacetylase/succinyl-diaminopimelate desuccinylase-like protein
MFSCHQRVPIRNCRQSPLALILMPFLMDVVATTGVFRIQPGAVNSVPFRADLEIDVRDINVDARDAALERIQAEITAITQRRGVSAATGVLNRGAPATCDPALIKTIEQSAANLRFSSLRMVSRAYHDALFMAQISPSAMIFIPCRDGVSRRPDEFASPEAIANGTRLLAEALRELAGEAEQPIGAPTPKSTASTLSTISQTQTRPLSCTPPLFLAYRLRISFAPH